MKKLMFLWAIIGFVIGFAIVESDIKAMAECYPYGLVKTQPFGSICIKDHHNDK